MRISFTNITNDWWNSLRWKVYVWIPAFAGITALATLPAQGFQLDAEGSLQGTLSDYQKMEAGLAKKGAVSETVWHLTEGRYAEALAQLTPEVERKYPWIRNYLEQLIPVSSALIPTDSAHFVLYTPPGQQFLAEYAIKSLEKTSDHIEKKFGHRPKGKIRVEIYPDKKTFSDASTLEVETLERSGAIGICKFHRLMIMSPRSLPMGYRWLDALSHEYLHLVINEITESRAELWLHEGTARYFETAYRSDPPLFITPHQQTALLEAQESETLIPFKRMSPSMVYLKNQEEVSLAFSQVAYAVHLLVTDKGQKKFTSFLSLLRREPFPKAFRISLGMSPDQFDGYWKGKLAEEKWQKSIGTLSDEIRFNQIDENSAVGADVQGRLRLGDRMRQRGHIEAALIEYEKALTDEPDNAILLLKAARTHLALNQADKAREKLRRATKKNPNYGTPHIELAALVEPEEALFHLLEANAINPFDPRVHKGLEDVYARLGRVEESRQEGEILRLLTAENR